MADAIALRSLFKKVERKYREGYLESDPIVFCHQYKRPLDRELVGFIAATLAFGNVRMIQNSCRGVLKTLGDQPVDFLIKSPELINYRQLPHHRWVTPADLHIFLQVLAKVYKMFGSLENMFFYDSSQSSHWADSIRRFAREFRKLLFSHQGDSAPSRGLKFLVPNPDTGTTLKRLNLFLRWMVRKKSPDLGVWTLGNSADLFIPIDTHMARISYYIGLTTKQTPSWQMVEEVTGRAKCIFPGDPTLFDFGLTRLGILKACKHRYIPDICQKCAFSGFCKNVPKPNFLS